MRPKEKPFYIYLASQSARRRDFLRRMGFDFEVIPSSYRERHRGNPAPEKLVLRHAAGKAGRACLPERLRRCVRPVVLGADTIVWYRGRILEKPADRVEARKMLTALSGREHWVYSGICIRDLVSGRNVSGWDRTRVVFHRWSGRQIDTYIQRVDPLDKAGGYAIQKPPFIVKAYEGSHSNVVGLPRALLRRLLRSLG